jgi:hypothetical protein
VAAAADRKDTQRFIDWSMRRELAEGYGNTPEPEFVKALLSLGGRAAEVVLAAQVPVDPPKRTVKVSRKAQA